MLYVGLCVDYRKAILVDIDENGSSCRRIQSHAEDNIRLSGGYGGATPYAPHDVAPERRFERKRRLHLHKYYQRLIRSIREADGIVLLGPGQARIELEKEIRTSDQLAKKLLSVEAADRMTDKQLKARMRSFFTQRSGQPVGRRYS